MMNKVLKIVAIVLMIAGLVIIAYVFKAQILNIFINPELDTQTEVPLKDGDKLMDEMNEEDYLQKPPALDFESYSEVDE